jgi:hypothetical protein
MLGAPLGVVQLFFIHALFGHVQAGGRFPRWLACCGGFG